MRIFVLLFFIGSYAFAQVNDSSSTFIQDYRINALIKKKISLNKDVPTVDCYVIQLFCGSRESANNLKAQFIEKFEKTHAFVIHETCFKLQVGKYKTKIKAEKELMKIRRYFNGAFIVKTKINPVKIN